MSTKIASLYAEIGAKDTLTPSLANAKKGITDLKGTFAGFAASAAALTGVAIAVGKAYNSTVGEFVKYADQVRSITQISGESAEATSRLVQVADDYKLTSNDLMTAQRILAKEGYSLNIETMAKLSDEYLKLNTGAERQAFLTEKLGRSGAVFAEMMTQGSTAILAKGAAVSAGLVLDQKALDNARAYEMALDDLNDQWSAFKISAGKPATEFATSLITTVNQLIAVRQELGSWSATFKMMGGEEKDVAKKEAAIERLNRLLGKAGGSSRITTFAELNTLPETVRWINASTEAITANYTAMAKYYTLPAAGAGFTGPQAPGVAAEGEIEAFGNLLDFSQKYVSIQEEMLAKENELADLRKRGWWEENPETGVLEWNRAYLETGKTIRGVKEDIKALGEEQTAMTNNLIVQMLMASGAPAQGIMAIAQSFGLISENALSAYVRASELAEAIAKIPANQIKTFEMYIKITGDVDKALMMTVGASGGATQWWQYAAQGKASGGPASGLFLTGDSSSGWTPWTEAVYAPGGAYVYNASETRRMFGGAGIRGYATGTNIKPKTINGVTGTTGMYKEGFVDTPASVTQILAEEVAAVVSAQVTAALVTTSNQVTVAVAPMVQEQQQTTSATQQGTQVQAAGNREMVGAIEDMKYMLSAQLANMGGDIISAVLRGT